MRLSKSYRPEECTLLSWLKVHDVDEELAELYAYQHEHRHNSVVFQHQNFHDVIVTYPRVGSRSPIKFEIIQNQSIQRKGQTGFCLWDSSICLAQFLADNSETLNLPGTDILELGSGSGLVSLSLLHHQPTIRSVTLTDQAVVLKHLQRNVNHHQGLYPKEASGTCVQIEELEWTCRSPFETHPSLSHLNHGRSQFGVDWLVSSDCVYNEHLVPPYVATIVAFIRHRRRFECEHQLPDCKALICFELRSDDVTQVFLERISAEPDISLHRLSQDHLPSQFQSGSIVIYCISLTAARE